MATKSESDTHKSVLAAFGKHPGWDDHIPIDALGCDAPGVAELRKLLYIQGIGGNIDAGGWDTLIEAERLDEFAHAFLWRRKGQLWAGRLWHSTDGRGRSAYPMVVVAQCTDQPLAWTLTELFPLLESVQTEIELATSAAGVEAALQAGRDRLREAVERESARQAAREGDQDGFSRSAASELASESALGPDRQGLHRVLYQFRREMAPHLADASGNQSRSGDERPGMLRAPKASPNTEVALGRWLRFANEFVLPATPILVVAPADNDWVDIVVGDPTPSQLFGLKASGAKVLSASDVPYNLEDEAIAELDAAIDRPVEEVRTEIVAPQKAGIRDVVQGRVNEGVKGIGTAIDGKAVGSWMSNPLIWAGIAAGALLLLGLVLLASSMGGGGSDPAAEQDRPSQGETQQEQQRTRAGNGSDGTATRSGSAAASGGSDTATVPVEVPGLTGDELAAWHAWCDAYGQWVGRFLADVDPAVVARDEFLARLLADPAAERIALDPKPLGTGRARLGVIRDNPPERARTAEGIALTAASLDRINQIRHGLESEWPAMRDIERATDSLEAFGWTGAAGELREAAAGIAFEPQHDLAAGVARVVEVAPNAGRLAAAFDAGSELVSTLDATGDPVLVRAEEALAVAGRRDDLATADRVAGDAVAAMRQVASAVESRWGRVDQEAFQQQSRVHTPMPEHVDALVLGRWRAEVSQDRFERLALEDDPRYPLSEWLADNPVEGLRAGVAELADRVAGDELAPIQELDSDLVELERRIASLRTVAWNLGNQREIVEGVAGIDSDIEAYRQALSIEQAALSQDFDELLASVRARTFTSSAALNEIGSELRDDLIEQHEGDRAFRELSASIEVMAAKLDRIDSLVSSVDLVPEDRLMGVDPAVVTSAADARAELARRGLALEVSWDDADASDALADAWAREQSDLEAWRVELASLASDASAVVDRIARCEAVDQDLRTALDDLRQQSADFGAAGLASPADAMIARIDAIDAMPTAELVGIGTNAASAWEAMAAWRALGRDASWPTGPRAMRDELAVANQLVGVLLGLEGEDVREAIEPEVRRGTGARWAGAMARASSASTLAELASLEQQAGGDRGVLSARVRGNLAIAELAGELRRAIDGRQSDQQIIDLLSAGVDRAEAAGVVGSFTRAWWGDVRDLGSIDPAEQRLDFTSVGPGTVGWTVTGGGRDVTYRSPDGQHAIAFRAVEIDPASGAVEFLSASEVSIGLLEALGWDASRWRELAGDWRSLDEAMNQPGADTWRGARSWRWDKQTSEITPNLSWLADNANGQRYPAFPDDRDAVTPPTATTPLQQVSASAAAEIAAGFGCRLPTVAGWRGALVIEGGKPAEANLRDRTFGIYQQHQAQIGRQPGVVAAYADELAMRPSGMDLRLGADAQHNDNHYDHTLWFEPVDIRSRSRGDRWQHLRGNVAEFVRAAGGEFMVIGGAALSDPAIPLEQPQPIGPRRRSVGFADVGLRLAFDFSDSESAQPLSFRVRNLLDRAPFDRSSTD